MPFGSMCDDSVTLALFYLASARLRRMVLCKCTRAAELASFHDLLFLCVEVCFSTLPYLILVAIASAVLSSY